MGYLRCDWNITAVNDFAPEVEGVGILWPVHIRNCFLVGMSIVVLHIVATTKSHFA